MIQRHLLKNIYNLDFEKSIQSTVNSLLENYKTNQMLGVSVFVDSLAIDDFISKKEIILSIYKQSFSNLPVNVVSQSPSHTAAVEVWTHESLEFIEHKCLDGICYSVFTDATGTYVFSLGLAAANFNLSLKQQSISAFNKMEQILSAEALSFDEVIRQWNYIPDIIERMTDAGEHLQNYQIFNDVREGVYRASKRNNKYPAATGIGVNTGNVMIDFLAAKLHANQHCVQLMNPQQIDAFEYSQKQLVGSAPDKKPPLFSRAMFVGDSKLGLVYISGTASIIGEETVGIDDVVLQTKITIENIEKLISAENIFKTTGFEFKDIKYSFARVYIKCLADFETVIAICEKYYAAIPLLFVQADICRDNLLVEIECELDLRN